MRRPDFFILGAPKAGTTALSRYLGEHDRIFVSNPKEPFYFCSDFSGLPRLADEVAYLSLFASANSTHLAVGEASAMYLYSKVAAGQIASFDPDARILISLRSPLELAVSFHAQQLYGMSEDEPDFETAWQLQSERAQGRSLPSLVREPAFLQYRKVALLGEQVERVLGMFSASQVHFVIFDDLVRDPLRVYRDVLTFLDVPDDGRRVFPVVNERKENRSRLLGRFLHRPPPILSSGARRFKALIGKQEVGFLDGIRRRNARKPEKASVSNELRLEMREAFEADIRLLSRLIGRDLGNWLEGRPLSLPPEVAEHAADQRFPN